MIGGAYIAYNAFPHDCCGDDPGLANIIYGGALGVWFGAALGASLPDMRSVCNLKTRFLRSFAGAVAGSFVGLAAGIGGGFVITTPLGAAGGSLVTLGRCWKSDAGRGDLLIRKPGIARDANSFTRSVAPGYIDAEPERRSVESSQ
jgi:hypothetical protein